MLLPSQLTDEQSDAIVDCLRVFAAHGRALRLERERQEKEKTKTDALGSAAVLADDNGTRICTDAKT